MTLLSSYSLFEKIEIGLLGAFVMLCALVYEPCNDDGKLYSSEGSLICLRHDRSYGDIYPRSMVVVDSTFSLEALTLVTLIATVILSAVRAIPIWKSSALAPMFHGVHVDITKSARVEKMKRWRHSLSIHRPCLSQKTGEQH
jgi:hypothetical protein